MTIQRHCQTRAPRATSATSITNSYEVYVDVHSDNNEDDGGLVVDYLKGQYPIGSSYAQPGYTDLLSIVKRISASKRQGSTEPNVVWECVVYYEPAQPAVERRDVNNQLQINPLEWRYEIDSVAVGEQVPIWEATNVDEYPMGGAPAADEYTRPAGTLGPVVNSAGVILDPPLMGERYFNVLRVSGYASEYRYDWTEPFMGAVNSSAMQFHDNLVTNYKMQQKDWAAGEVWCTAAEARFDELNDYQVWQYTYEFRFKVHDDTLIPYEPSIKGDAWRVHVLDQGITRRAAVGSPDGEGSTIPDPGAGDLEPGKAVNAAIRDWEGNRVPEKTLLNGRGQPEVAYKTLPAESRWFRYEWRDKMPMTLLPLDIFQVPS